MMNQATTAANRQPTITSQRDALYCRAVIALLHDRRLQVELHPRRDRRADQPDHHVAGSRNCGCRRLRAADRRERGRLPVGMRQHARRRCSRRRTADADQEDLFDAVVGALDHEHPDDRRGERHDDVARDAEQLEAARDAGELRHHVAEVGDDQRQHQEERDPEAELLANQIAQALAGDRAHARRHLLHDDQRDRGRNHRPQQRVAELRAGHRVGPDAAGVVVDVRGDEPGTDDREEQHDARAPAS